MTQNDVKKHVILFQLFTVVLVIDEQVTQMDDHNHCTVITLQC